MLKRKNSELQPKQQIIKKTKITKPVFNYDILENILKYSMLIVEKTNKIIPPSSVTFNFKSESYSSKCIDTFIDDMSPIIYKHFVRDISHLLNLSLVNKHFYYFLFNNLFRLEIFDNKDNMFNEYNNNKTYEITMKRLFFTPDWIFSFII